VIERIWCKSMVILNWNVIW